MNTKIKISKTSDKIKSILIFILLISIFIISVTLLNLDIVKFLSRISSAKDVLRRLMSINFNNLPNILLGMLSSVCIAVSGLIIGIIISMILAFLSAANIAPSKTLASFIKGAVAVIRAVPALVWILMVVASIGFGNTGGMIGLVFPTVGYLTKSFTSSIEGLGYNTIEAMRTTGAGWLIIVTKGLMPSLVNPFSSWIAIRLEGNIAESINLGMVGVAGIGSVLNRALMKYDYGSITTIILVIFITMLIVENLVNKMKKKLN